ncbi:MAG TPA: hypothetical protein VFI15_10250 [Candidatus Limnocylindrales bacterium]|nr:hypothetical protein [Candidatus Limnocylindrales bacterium]
MSGKRWSRWLAAPLALVAVGLLLSRFQPGAEAGGKTAPPKAGACAGAAPLGHGIDAATMAAGHGTWWRLTDTLDPKGELVGRTLFAGRAAKTTLTMPLGTESMARGPVGGLLLATTDDGRSSEVRLVSIADGCAWLVHRDQNVVRSAILDPATGVAYAHLVQRATRVDLGVFRLAGGDPDATLDQVVEPLGPQTDLGPIWATELRLNADGTALAVQSCSDQGCMTRVVALAAFGRPVSIVRGNVADATNGQGSIIGFAGDRIITWAFCAGMPCPIQSWTAGDNKPVTLVDRAVGAGVTRDGRYLLYVTDSTGYAVRVDFASNAVATVTGVNPDELPLGASVTATAGLDLGDGEIGLASNGGDARALAPGAAVVLP